MLLFAIIAVFIAGLMIGRTPEYVGKKIAATEVKMTILAILCIPLVILGLTAIASVLSPPASRFGQQRPAWFLRDALRLHLGGDDQRQRLCRA